MPKRKRKTEPKKMPAPERVPDYIPYNQRIRLAEDAEDAANRKIGQALTGRMCPSEDDVISKLKRAK